MLQIFRRHYSPCPHTSRRYRRCACPIWVQGSLGGEWVKRSLNLTSWEAASDLVSRWTASGTVGEVKVDVPPLQKAIEQFLADCRAQHLSSETLRKYESLLERRMLPWAEKQGKTKLKNWDVSTVREFRQAWTDGPIYATKNLERLRSFFRFCVSEKWVKENPAKGVKAPKADVAPTIPFSEEEMKSILKATDVYRGNKKRIRAFILVMRYAGLRISDAVSLKRESVQEGRIFLRMEKTSQPVWVPVPAIVTNALSELPADGERYFWNGRGTLRTRTANWARYLASVFESSGVKDAHSHRFRDTFAVSLLLAGVPIGDVSILLGHSSIKITEKHYAPWVRERQDRLEKLVLSAYKQTT